MLVAATYLSTLLLAVVTVTLAVPAIWIPCVVLCAVLALRLELVWALGKLVRVPPIRIDEEPRPRPRHA